MVRIMQYLQNVDNFALVKQQLIESGILDKTNETIIRMAPEAVDPAILSRGSLSRRRYTRSALLLLRNEESSMRKPKCMDNPKLSSYPFWKPKVHFKSPDIEAHSAAYTGIHRDLFSKLDRNVSNQQYRRRYSNEWRDGRSASTRNYPKGQPTNVNDLSGFIRKDMMSAIPKPDSHHHVRCDTQSATEALMGDGHIESKVVTVPSKIEPESLWDDPVPGGNIWEFQNPELELKGTNEDGTTGDTRATPPPARSTPAKFAKKNLEDGKNGKMDYNFDEILKLDAIGDMFESTSSNKQIGESRFSQWFKSSNPSTGTSYDQTKPRQAQGGVAPTAGASRAPTNTNVPNQSDALLRFLQQIRNNNNTNAINIMQLNQLVGSLNPLVVAYRNLIFQLMQRNGLKSVEQVEALMKRQMSGGNIFDKFKQNMQNMQNIHNMQARMNPWANSNNEVFQQFLDQMKQINPNISFLNTLRQREARKHQELFRRQSQRQSLPTPQTSRAMENLKLALSTPSFNQPRTNHPSFMHGARRNTHDAIYNRRNSTVFNAM